MLLRPNCVRCDRKASVEWNGAPYCVDHAADKVIAYHGGKVPQPKPIR